MKPHAIRYSVCSLLLALLSMLPLAAAAQGLVPVTVHTKMEAGSGSQKSTRLTAVRYTVFRSVKKATEAKDKLEAAISKSKNPNAFDDAEGTEAAIQAASKRLDIVWSISQANGIFETNAIVGSGILVLGEDGVMAVRKVEGKGVMEITLKGNIELAQVDVFGKGSRLKFTDIPTIDTGGNARFSINYWLAKGETNEKNRIIIQPIVIDCQTEDTVAYLDPFVYEGAEYHKLQDKRFAFDYNKNDSVARGYQADVVLSRDREFSMNQSVSFRKPNKDASYRCVYPVVLEDYLHVISVEGKENGSCNSIKPFKFLNLSSGVAEMKLTSDFKEDAAARFDEHQQDVSLTFETNSDVLTDDSLNTVKMRELSKELRSYGDKLFQVTVQGGASAEGSVEHNTKLAQRRSDRALRLLAQYGLPSDVGRTTLPPKVFTWQDVLAEVEKQGNEETTQIVRNTIENHKQNEVFGILKGLPIFETVIDPILVSQRMMRCTYLVSRERVMEPNEAVEEYFAHKKQYVSRSKDIKPLSMGDYYNLFSVIKDSLELDTLTRLAYSQMIEQPSYETLPIAPYLANRMAVINLKQGTADLKVLEPFINFNIKPINHWIQIDQFHKRLINIEDILINQAMTYFMAESEKSGKAKYILWDWLPQTEKVKKVQMLSTFQNLYLSYITGELKSPDDIQKAREAEAYVLNSSDENRAIINTELRKFIGKTRKDVEPLVDKMDDSNAKKWYLKGLLWADDAGKEPVVSSATGGDNGFKELTLEEELRLQREDPAALEEYYKQLEGKSKTVKQQGTELNVDTIPYFLAYFQHSFDMQPEYRKLFYREGNIDESVRKRYKYRKKDIPSYRRKFEIIKAAADRDREFDNIPEPGAGGSADAGSGATSSEATPTVENSKDDIDNE